MKELRIETECEVRAEAHDLGKKIGGYAAVFGKLSQDLGGFREKIAPGAFARSIADKDVRALWSHNIDMLLGRTGNQTLRLEENQRGLKFELDLPDTQLGRDVFVLVSRQDVAGVSFGFRVLKDSWDYNGGKKDEIIRTLEDVELLEISPTAFPAYEQTQVYTRDMESVIERGLEALKAKEPESIISTPYRLLEAKIALRLRE